MALSEIWRQLHEKNRYAVVAALLTEKEIAVYVPAISEEPYGVTVSAEDPGQFSLGSYLVWDIWGRVRQAKPKDLQRIGVNADELSSEFIVWKQRHADMLRI